MAKTDNTNKKGRAKASPKSLQKQFRHNLLHETVGDMTVTEAEACISGEFRRLVRASKSQRAYSDWSAWEQIRTEASHQERGNAPDAQEIAADPALYAAVSAVRAFLSVEQARHKADAKAERKERKARKNG